MEEERPVSPPLVSSDGRMDVIASRHGHKLLADIVIGTTATVQERERARRVHEPGRSLKIAEARKFARYGPAVLAVAVEDTGRLGSGTVRLLRDLVAEDEDPASEYRRLVAELQHVVLSATASMLQIARGSVTTI